MRRIVPQNAMLIPNNAQKVFAGEIFDVYQWPQKLYDGSVATYEMLRRPDTVQILCVKDGNIIATDEQQSGRPSYVRLPGGRVEPGESWLTAAKRECLEELGMEFATWKLVQVRQPIVKIEWFVATFVATGFVTQHEPQRDAGEHINVLELSLEDWKRRLAGEQSPLADYAKLFFAEITSLQQLAQLPAFKGKEID